MMQKRQDYFLLHPPRQPKREIAEYVKRNGILVPDIYDTFKDAKKAEKQGKHVLARSEHPQEYAGVSGLLVSLPIADFRSEAKAKDAIMGLDFVKSNLENFFKYLNVERERFLADFSVSYWQKIGGRNFTIAKDSSAEGKYILAERRGSMSMSIIYPAIVQNGKLVYYSKLNQIDGETITRLMNLYNSVASLGKFNPAHCPIIEAQMSADGKIYFLQYHRARDFEPANFVLERPRGSDEVEADFVRGITPPDGKTFNTTFYYAHGPFVNQIMASKTGLMHTAVPPSFSRTGLSNFITAAHTYFSLMFKPEISILSGLSWQDRIPSEKIGKYGNINQDVVVTFQAVSDGKKAYVELLDVK